VTEPLWWDDPYAGHTAYGSSLPTSVDVCIVGGGYTGLWTAYYLLRAQPDLSVAVLEAEHVGFGASGRNGGWVSALWPVGADAVAARHGRSAALDMLAALRDTVDEVGRVVAEEAVDCGFVKGGALALARNPAQAARAQREAEHGASWRDGTMWLPAGEARERLAATGVLGATLNPHCARVQPRRLVDGLAAAVRRKGGLVAEGCRVASARPGLALLEDGRQVRTRHVVRATEAWTARLPGLRRRIAPVYSLMVATEPLPVHLWERIGLRAREVFADHRHIVVYGQRSVDDRVVFGGRGAPYHLGSAIHPAFDHDERVFRALRATVADLLPQLSGVRFTHAWGGPLGIARDWNPAVGYDPAARLGWAGGYVGDGVAAANLAGRTLADLLTGHRTALTRLPWVGHRSPAWEPEPLRWLGVNAGLRLAALADREEALTGRPARVSRLLEALTGR
jgi:glycine/D-amino acid oxidase-like deaminating enzyme